LEDLKLKLDEIERLAKGRGLSGILNLKGVYGADGGKAATPAWLSNLARYSTQGFHVADLIHETPQNCWLAYVAIPIFFWHVHSLVNGSKFIVIDPWIPWNNTLYCCKKESVL
jgi:hypothetical protein